MHRLTLLSLALLLLGATVAVRAAAPAKPTPVDPALLEFLADWQGPDGAWVDPMTFMRIDPAKVRADVRDPVPTPAAVSAVPGEQAR